MSEQPSVGDDAVLNDMLGALGKAVDTARAERQSAENDTWDCDHHPEWADRRNVCHHPDHKTRRCPKCESADLRTGVSGRVTCRDCEKRHKRERKDRRHRERGDRCGCGADVASLNPAEVVVHNWGGGACRIVPVTRSIPPGTRP